MEQELMPVQAAHAPHSVTEDAPPADAPPADSDASPSDAPPADAPAPGADDLQLLLLVQRLHAAPSSGLASAAAAASKGHRFR